jgi:hypothetical protein
MILRAPALVGRDLRNPRQSQRLDRLGVVRCFMKTGKHRLLCASLAALVFITTTSHLQAALNTFTNAGAWSTALSAAGSSGATIFGFNFIPPNPRPEAISNQFAGAGFEFLAQDGRFPITIDYVTNGVLSTPLLPNSGQMMRWRFTRLINAVGWDRATADDTHVYRIFDTNNVEIGMIDFRTPTQLGGPVFGGFLSDVPIGFVSSFSDSNDQLHSIDNLRYAFAPGPICPELSIRSSQVELCWSSQNNRLYQLQYRSDSTTNMWTDLGAPVQGNGATNCVYDAIVSGQPQRFYRILCLSN